MILNQISLLPYLVDTRGNNLLSEIFENLIEIFKILDIFFSDELHSLIEDDFFKDFGNNWK